MRWCKLTRPRRSLHGGGNMQEKRKTTLLPLNDISGLPDNNENPWLKKPSKEQKLPKVGNLAKPTQPPPRMLNMKNYSKRNTFHTKTCFLWQFCAFVKSVLRFFLKVTFYLRKRGRTSALRKSIEVLSSTGNSYSSRYWHLLTFSMALPYIASESRLFSVIDSC